MGNLILGKFARDYLHYSTLPFSMEKGVSGPLTRRWERAE